jgi:hypothetical protein
MAASAGSPPLTPAAAAPPTLRRSVTPWGSFSWGYSDVGADIFVGLGLVLGAAAGASNVAFLFAGIVYVCVGLAYTELDESVAHGIAGAELMTSDGGTGVPGINGQHSMQVFFRNESISDRLGDLKIPDSEMDNYLEALQRGRTLVAYFTKPEAMDQVEAIFRDAQLLNVRRY